MRSVHNVLDGVIELLTPPAHWTQGTLARSGPWGPSVNPLTNKAKCFCMMGAKQKVLGHLPARDRLEFEVRTKLAVAAFTLFPDRSGNWVDRSSEAVTDFNDHLNTTHDDVLQVLRLARAL